MESYRKNGMRVWHAVTIQQGDIILERKLYGKIKKKGSLIANVELAKKGRSNCHW